MCGGGVWRWSNPCCGGAGLEGGGWNGRVGWAPRFTGCTRCDGVAEGRGAHAVGNSGAAQDGTFGNGLVAMASLHPRARHQHVRRRMTSGDGGRGERRLRGEYKGEASRVRIRVYGPFAARTRSCAAFRSGASGRRPHGWKGEGWAAHGTRVTVATWRHRAAVGQGGGYANADGWCRYAVAGIRVWLRGACSWREAGFYSGSGGGVGRTRACGRGDGVVLLGRYASTWPHGGGGRLPAGTWLCCRDTWQYGNVDLPLFVVRGRATLCVTAAWWCLAGRSMNTAPRYAVTRKHQLACSPWSGQQQPCQRTWTTR